MINERNKTNMSSLHAACLSGNRQIVKLLIENKADMYIKDQNGFLPIHYAVVVDSVSILEELVLQDYKVNDKQFQF